MSGATETTHNAAHATVHHLAASRGVAGIPQIPQAATGERSARLPIEELLLRMRGGDREAAAVFLMRYETRIRRRIRGKLGPSIRRLFDSMEILSTLGRRLDLYVMSGRVQADDESQMLGLLFKMAENALVDKARVFRRLESVESADSEFAHELEIRLRKAESECDTGAEIELENWIKTVGDPIDRRILSLWLAGETHGAIAQFVEKSPTAIRKRWEKIKSELKDRFETAGR